MIPSYSNLMGVFLLSHPLGKSPNLGLSPITTKIPGEDENISIGNLNFVMKTVCIREENEFQFILLHNFHQDYHLRQSNRSGRRVPAFRPASSNGQLYPRSQVTSSRSVLRS